MRRNAVLPHLAVLAALTIAAPRAVLAQAAVPLDRAAWLAGCWEHRSGAQVTTEMWMLASGGLMLGAGRTVEGDTARQWEYLLLRANGERLVYTAIPSGQTEASFTTSAAAHAGADTLVFANPAHDFPQRISYWRVGEDSLVVRVEGPGPDGGTRGFDQPMRRVPCAPPVGAPPAG